MFVPTWLIFLFSGTVMAIVVLTWGIRHHQFEDQNRARYLALGGLTEQELTQQPPVRRGVTYYLLIGLMALAPLTLFAALAVVYAR